MCSKASEVQSTYLLLSISCGDEWRRTAEHFRTGTLEWDSKRKEGWSGWTGGGRGSWIVRRHCCNLWLYKGTPFSSGRLRRGHATSPDLIKLHCTWNMGTSDVPCWGSFRTSFGALLDFAYGLQSKTDIHPWRGHKLTNNGKIKRIEKNYEA